jgi:hypothetical protein
VRDGLPADRLTPSGVAVTVRVGAVDGLYLRNLTVDAAERGVAER